MQETWGEPLAVFGPVKARFGAWAGGIGLVGAGAVLAQDDPVFLPVFGVLGLPVLAFAYALERAKLWFYDDGVVRRGALGTTTLAFKDVVEIRRPRVAMAGSNVGVPNHFRGRNGEKLGLFGLGKGPAAGIAEGVLQRVLPLLAGELEGRMKRGEEIAFGKKVRATKDHIVLGDTAVLYKDISNISTSPEGTRIFPEDRPELMEIVPLKVPNTDVLVELWARAAARQSDDPMSINHRADEAHHRSVVAAEGFDAVDADLGKLVCVRQVRPVSRALAYGFVGLSALATLGISVGLYQSGQVVEAGLPLLVEALVAAIVFVALRNFPAAVYEKGVAKRKGRVRFDELEHLTYAVVDQYVNGAYAGRNISLVLEGRGGAKLKLNGQNSRFEAFCDTVLSRSMPVVIRRVVKSLGSGGAFKVGKLEVWDDHITWKGERYGWDRISHMEVQEGFVHLWKDGEERSFVQVGLNDRDGRILLPLLTAVLSPSPPDPAQE